jgi:osmotically-inducible protein OsmY
MNKTDKQIKDDVLAELAWDPAINADNIGVIVKDGVVTLTGHIGTYTEKMAAEKAVRHVAGVKAMAVELDVKLSTTHARSDTEIAQAALHSLRWHTWVPSERLQVEVDQGWVTLSGDVDWQYQLVSAEQSVRNLLGVRGISNRIVLKPHISNQNISEQISAALARHAKREAERLQINVDKGTVTLKGSVDSLAERDAVIGAAYGTRGVAKVIDQLNIHG